MKKKPNGFVSVLLALCLLLAPMTVFAESNAQLNYVTDDAGILTDSQWEDLEQRAQQVSEEYQCGVYMITVDDYTDYRTLTAHFAVCLPSEVETVIVVLPLPFAVTTPSVTLTIFSLSDFQTNSEFSIFADNG